MRFISWNVNGLRACVQKGFLEFFHLMNADFFCLQETKLQEGQIQLELPGVGVVVVPAHRALYEFIRQPARHRGRRYAVRGQIRQSAR